MVLKNYSFGSDIMIVLQQDQKSMWIQWWTVYWYGRPLHCISILTYAYKGFLEPNIFVQCHQICLDVSDIALHNVTLTLHCTMSNRHFYFNQPSVPYMFLWHYEPLAFLQVFMQQIVGLSTMGSLSQILKSWALICWKASVGSEWVSMSLNKSWWVTRSLKESKGV